MDLADMSTVDILSFISQYGVCFINLLADL